MYGISRIPLGLFGGMGMGGPFALNFSKRHNIVRSNPYLLFTLYLILPFFCGIIYSSKQNACGGFLVRLLGLLEKVRSC